MGKTHFNTIKKANGALYAIKLIKKYLYQVEILTLLTANFHSILFYNSKVWHIPALKPELKQILFSAYANAFQNTPDRYESFVNIHENCKRAHLDQLINYKHSSILHKIHNSHTPQIDWIDLNFNQTFMLTLTTFNEKYTFKQAFNSQRKNPID